MSNRQVPTAENRGSTQRKRPNREEEPVPFRYPALPRELLPSTLPPDEPLLVINNDGAGFADYVNVPEETTVQQLFSQRVPGARPQDYLIRVNRQPVAADQVLHEGDRVSFTPVKIEGATSARGRYQPAS
jgi:sulfur carrier protein ThiS